MLSILVTSAHLAFADDAKVVWKLGHSAYEGDPIYFFAEKVKENVEKAFAGKVEVQVFPAGQLGDYVAQQEQMQMGGLEFNIPVTSSLSTIVPEMGFSVINFILSPNYAVTDAAFNEGKACHRLNEKLEEQGIHVIRWVGEDFSCWSSNIPLRKLEDFDGLKIRVYPSSQVIENYRIIKANPTPIPFAEVYSALQLNVAQAQENPIPVIYSNKFYEVQKYVTISNHTMSTNLFSAGKWFWDTLVKEDQDKIKSAVNEAALSMIDQQEGDRNKAIENIKAYGNTSFLELDPAERKRLENASLPARDVYIKSGGAEAEKILDLWLADVAEFEEKLLKK